ncbi:phosphotransferase [Longispora sp. NPDC051575]|uniref:phosphotransferase enzyme family protein n=1 Tax=Longispora sp. NPDC051575 TaxID=3154943 RepID=UPI00341484C5
MAVPVLTEATFAAAGTRLVLEQACQLAGIDSTGARLLRHQTNAVWLLAARGLIVKISRPAANADRERATLALAGWLAAEDFPALAPTMLEPQRVGGCLVTIWPYLPQDGLPPVQAADLGHPLRTLHTLHPPMGLPRLAAVAAIRHSLAASRILAPADRTFLEARCDDLARRLAGVHHALPTGLIHADPHHANALATPSGTTLLIDWDSACLGPPEWDLVTIEVHCRRFYSGSGQSERFSTAYGLDIRNWTGFETYRDLRELRMISTNARKSPPGSPEAAEVHRRIIQVRDQDTRTPWRRL